MEARDAVLSLCDNPNNPIGFVSRSLPEPVLNEYGDVIRRAPHDSQAQPVKNSLGERLRQAGKLLVLLGSNTHSREWVKWEIDTFRSLHGDNADIFLMRIKGNVHAGKPNNIDDEIYDWDTKLLKEWLES